MTRDVHQRRANKATLLSGAGIHMMLMVMTSQATAFLPFWFFDLTFLREAKHTDMKQKPSHSPKPVH